jgi:hypothetical protein
MKTNTSPRARLLAVLALILAAGACAYLLMQHSGGSSSASKPVLTQTNSTTGTTATTTQTTTTAKPRPKPKSKPKPSSGVAALDTALVNHPVVVVSLYAPNVALDTAAMNEAKAGAAAVDAGFVSFNIYDEKQARQIASLLGSDFTVANPEVLFFKRPRSLAFELQGFVDSQVVAQAAANIFPSWQDPWVNRVNRICMRYDASLSPLESTVRSADTTTAAGRTDAAAALEQAASLFNEEARALSAIKVGAAEASNFARLNADFRQAAANMSSEARALRGANLAASRTVERKNAALTNSINTLVAKLNILDCSG